MSALTNISRNRSNSWSPEKEKSKAYVGSTGLNSEHNACSEIKSHSMDSPVSKSLLNAFLEVCETKVQLDQFLKRQGSQTHYQEDNDNMSTELRMLRSSEEKLRLDLENLDTSIFLPSLCDSSQTDSQGSNSHQEICGNSSLVDQDIEDGYSCSSICTSSKTLPTVCTTSLHSTCISESITSHEHDYIYDIPIIKDNSDDGANSQDQDVFDIMSSYLFGCHNYRVKSLWDSKELSNNEYTRNIQGTACVFLSTFVTCSGLQSQSSFPYVVCSSLLVSAVITFLEVKTPHKICEVHLAAFILCMYIFLIPYVN